MTSNPNTQTRHVTMNSNSPYFNFKTYQTTQRRESSIALHGIINNQPVRKSPKFYSTHTKYANNHPIANNVYKICLPICHVSMLETRNKNAIFFKTSAYSAKSLPIAEATLLLFLLYFVSSGKCNLSIAFPFFLISE